MLKNENGADRGSSRKIQLFAKQAEMGFSLIPLVGKIPNIGKGWEKWGLEKREFNPKEYANGRNAGICAGPGSGVIFLDVDDFVIFSAIAKAENLDMPETYSVYTGSGHGYHNYYEYPKDGSTIPGKSVKHPLFPKHTIFDIKSVGGQCVAAGSIHPDTGAEYVIEKDLPIVPMPDWMMKLCLNQYQIKLDAALNIPPTKPASREMIDTMKGNISGRVKGLIIEGMPTGARSETIGAVLTALCGAGIHENIIRWIFENYAIGEKYREKGSSRDRWLSGEIQRAKQHCSEDMFSGAESPGSDSAGGDQDTNIIGLNIADFLNMAIPPREYIIEPILPQQGLVSIYAPRGMGKTYVLLTLAAAVSLGKGAFNWKTPKARRVLYIDGEMPARTMQERIARILSNYGADDIDPSFFQIITPDLNPEYTLNLSREADQKSIDKYVEAAELIIIDSLSTCARHGEENRAESWLPVQEYLLKLRRRGKAVIFAHHAGKNGQQRGTSAKEDILDTVIALKRPQDYREEEGARFEVKFEKARGICGDDVKSFEAKLEQDGDRLFWTCRDIEDVRLEQVKALQDEGMTVREIAEEMGISKSSVHRLIKKL